MKERLSKLYREHKITEAGLRYWVEKGVISQSDMDEILRENATEEDSIPNPEAYYIQAVKSGAMTLADVPQQYRFNVGLAVHMGA